MHHVRVVVEGRVQGVGFRAFARREGERLGLRGVVWNRADGAVEAEAEGERAALESFLSALRQGPGGAAVERVRVEWFEGPSRHRGFTVAASRPW
uniref:acylphosphatase n=1 Tax=Eiseniibacteriota bacterium TaxID=2212470 RepID=A0A832I137_UNCEI